MARLLAAATLAATAGAFLAPAPTAPVVAVRAENSEAFPFLKRPEKLDGSMVGDVGFDPLGFSKYAPGAWWVGDEGDGSLKIFREAELMHGRIAQLACLGWVFPELAHFPGKDGAFGKMNPFEAVDAKKRGAIDARRFREALQNVACVSDAEARCLFDVFDRDGSGSIDRAEFLSFYADQLTHRCVVFCLGVWVCMCVCAGLHRVIRLHEVGRNDHTDHSASGKGQQQCACACGASPYAQVCERRQPVEGVLGNRRDLVAVQIPACARRGDASVVGGAV